MDALRAYGSSDSDEEDVSVETDGNLVKTDQRNRHETNQRLPGRLQPTSDYSQFSTYHMPYSDHHTWIPNNLVAKLKRKENFNSKANMFMEEIGPQVSTECVLSVTSNTQLCRSRLGPIKSTDVANSKKTSVKLRPYVPKRERQKSTLQTDNGAIETTVSGSKNDIDTLITDTDSSSGLSTVINKLPKRVLYDFTGHSNCINCLRWNPSKQNLLASASLDHTVGIWDTYRKGLCLTRLTLHEAAVKDVKWTTCGTKIVSCGFDKCAKLVDVETGKLIKNFAHKQFVTCVQFHPNDSNLFLCGTSRNGIYCWDIRRQEVIASFQAPFGQVQDMVFLPGGEEFVSAAEVLRRNSTDKGIMVWDFRTTAIMSNQIYQEAFTCTCLKVHPSGTFFAAQSNADYIALFSTKRPYKLNKYKRFEDHQVSAYVIGFDFSPDGSIVTSGSADGKMYIYNSQTSRNIASIPVHSSVCMDASFHPSSPSTVATCSFDGQIAILG